MAHSLPALAEAVVSAMQKRQAIIEGDIARLPVSRGLEAIIDASDVPLVEAWNWTAIKVGKAFYVYRRQSDAKKTAIYLHRVLMNAPNGVQVDHINRNPLDNRKANLRLATVTQNLWNQGVSKRNTSGTKGVAFIQQRQKWRATIMVNGKNRHLGYFARREDAAAAYAKAVYDERGDFGWAAP
jgi:hypothetical protein